MQARLVRARGFRSPRAGTITAATIVTMEVPVSSIQGGVL